MATFQETWLNEYDHQPVQTTPTLMFQNTVFRMKELLCGEDPVSTTGIWTVQLSSDGASSGAADYWVDSGDIISADNGSVHSWIVLRSPDGMLPNSKHVEICIDCNADNGGVATEELTIWATTDVDYFSGGTTSNSPPVANASSEQIEITGNVAADAQILENDPSNDAHRMHMIRNERGDFLIMVSKDGTGNCEWWWCSQTVDRLSTSIDNYPVFMTARRDTTYYLSVRGGYGGGTYFPEGWWIDGGQDGSNLWQTTIVDMSNMDAALLDKVNGGLIPKIPIHMYSNNSTANQVGYRGLVPDIRAAGDFTGRGPAVELDTNPGADSYQYVKINGLYLPITATVTEPTL